MLKQAINQDKNLYCREDLPMVTIYDDNWFLRNDYDLLAPGQRHYLISFFEKQGFKLATGKTLTKDGCTIHLPRPQSNLAVSAFDKSYLSTTADTLFCVTPTQFAEALFYRSVHTQNSIDELVTDLNALIEHCPFNIEWLRDISYHSPIEHLTINTYSSLVAFQKKIVEKKFKKKKSLR